MKNKNVITAILCTSLLLTVIQSLKSQDEKAKLPEFTSVDIGKIREGSTSMIHDGKGIRLLGYGRMFGMHLNSDEGRFAYVRLKGDFDIIIQLDSVWSSAGAFAEGGLMVRKDLDPRGLYVANFVTNNNYPGETDQYTFQFRVKPGGSIEPYWDMAIDSFYGYHTKGNPAYGYSARGWNKTNTPGRNYPYVWLRIIRQGNTYKGYRRSGKASDWGEWEKMAEINLDLGESPLVGIALSANHHAPTLDGKLGDPASKSEISVLSMSINQ